MNGADNFVLAFSSGNANKSGETIEGNAWLEDATQNFQQLAFGHATVWGNATNFTATFHGTTLSGGALDFHVTANKHGVAVASLSCS